LPSFWIERLDSGLRRNDRNLRFLIFTIPSLFALNYVLGAVLATVEAKIKIVHDAKYYVLDAQHRYKWAAKDEWIESKLRALKKYLNRRRRSAQRFRS
jgi:hypothetical protein